MRWSDAAEDRRVIRAAASGRVLGRAPVEGADFGRILYRAAWRALREAEADAWFHQRSLGRRWLPSAGGEWRLLQAAVSFIPASHVLRALAGGLRGEAGAQRRVVTPISAPIR